MFCKDMWNFKLRLVLSLFSAFAWHHVLCVSVGRGWACPCEKVCSEDVVIELWLGFEEALL